MKYFGIIDKNVAAIFQLQWKIGNISDMFLQYSVLCGYLIVSYPHSTEYCKKMSGIFIIFHCNWNIIASFKYLVFFSIKYLFVFKNISESWNCNVGMKYFAIFNRNVATIFQLQWNIGNIPDIFLQYSVLCGINSKDFFFK